MPAIALFSSLFSHPPLPNAAVNFSGAFRVRRMILVHPCAAPPRVTARLRRMYHMPPQPPPKQHPQHHFQSRPEKGSSVFSPSFYNALPPIVNPLQPPLQSLESDDPSAKQQPTYESSFPLAQFDEPHHSSLAGLSTSKGRLPDFEHFGPFDREDPLELADLSEVHLDSFAHDLSLHDPSSIEAVELAPVGFQNEDLEIAYPYIKELIPDFNPDEWEPYTPGEYYSPTVDYPPPATATTAASEPLLTPGIFTNPFPNQMGHPPDKTFLYPVESVHHSFPPKPPFRHASHTYAGEPLQHAGPSNSIPRPSLHVQPSLPSLVRGMPAGRFNQGPQGFALGAEPYTQYNPTMAVPPYGYMYYPPQFGPSGPRAYSTSARSIKGDPDEEEKPKLRRRKTQEFVEDDMLPTKSPLKPPKKAASAWQLYFTDYVSKHRERAPGERIDVAQEAKDAARLYHELPSEEMEKYTTKATIAKREYERQLLAWQRTLRPADVRAENAFRTAQRRSGKSRKSNLKDPNAPKKPLSAYFLFQKDIRASPANMQKVFGDVTETTAQSVKAAEHWRGLSEAEKKPYLERAERAKQKYEVERQAYEEYVEMLPAGTDLSNVWQRASEAHAYALETQSPQSSSTSPTSPPDFRRMT